MNRVPAGVLTENDNGSFTFRYDDGYFSNPACSSISLTLPKAQQEHRSETIFPFFANMLSEGVNRQVQLRRFKVDDSDDFGLLMAVRGDTIGAVTVEGIGV